MRILSFLESKCGRFLPGTSAREAGRAHAGGRGLPLWCVGSFTAERVIMGLLVAASLGAYVATLCPGVYPGESAVLTAQALGYLPGAVVGSPVWLALSRGVAALSLSDAPYRLNLLSALCASLAVAGVFRVTKRLIVRLYGANEALRMVPVDEEEALEGRGPLVPAPILQEEQGVLQRVHLVATLGAVVGALYFAFCAPFWVSANAFREQPFDLLMTVFAADLVLSYAETGNLRHCMTAIVVMGAMAVESAMFVIVAPILLVAIVRVCIWFEQICESFVLLALAFALLGLSAGLGLLLLASHGALASVSDAWHVCLVAANTHARELQSLVSRERFFFVTALPFACLALVAAGSHAAVFCRDVVATWKWRISLLIGAAYVAANLVNAPKTVWAVARDGASLPVLPELALALACGMLVAYGLRLATEPEEEPGDSQAHAGRGLAGWGGAALLLILALHAVDLNYAHADGRRARFADTVAQAVLGCDDGVRCLVTDGMLDLNLLIAARASGRELMIVPAGETGYADRGEERAPMRRLQVVAQSRGAEAACPSALVEQWLRAHPEDCRQVAVVGAPALLRRAGLTGLPNGMVYSAAPAVAAAELDALNAKNLALWTRLVSVVSDDPEDLPLLRRIRTTVRTHVSRLANDMAALYERRAREDVAEGFCVMALELDKQNASAALNRFAWRVFRSPSGSQGSDVHGMLAPFASATPRQGAYEAFTQQVQRYGEVLDYPADQLMPRLFKLLPPGDRFSESELQVLDTWLTSGRSRAPVALAPGDVVDRMGLQIAASGRMIDEGRDPDLWWALSLLLQGQGLEAEAIVGRLVRNHPNDLRAFSLLVELLHRRGAHQAVSESLLPAMRAIVLGKENPFVLMAQGCVCMHMEPARLKEARVCLLRALDLNPRLLVAKDWLMEVDARLGDGAKTESDARLVLGLDRTHAGANAALGRLCAAQGRYAEAETHFRTSLARAPSAEVLCWLSELYRTQRRFDEAERQARLAVRLSPCLVSAWADLSEALTAGGRRDEAAETQSCAQRLSQSKGALTPSLISARGRSLVGA